MVKDESTSKAMIVPLRMINLVKHNKKHNNALPVKPNLHVKAPKCSKRRKTGVAASSPGSKRERNKRERKLRKKIKR